MAYGNYCPICRGTVDGNEFDFAKEMCKECVAEQEREEIKQSEVARLINAVSMQMRLEDIKA